MEPRLTRYDYDSGALAGMAMTSVHGGSDVRANLTRAHDAATAGSSCTAKWFCSYPCDIPGLAQTATGLSCFVLERGPGMEFQTPEGQARHALAAERRGRVPRRPRALLASRAGACRRSSAWSTTRGWIACSARRPCTAGDARAIHLWRDTVAPVRLKTHRAPAMRNVLADLALDSRPPRRRDAVARAYDEGDCAREFPPLPPPPS